jgi:translation initiation factor 1
MPGLFAGTPLERPVTCDVCGKTLAECRCPRNAAGRVVLPSDQDARVRRERRSSGKTVTVIAGLDPVATDLAGLLKQLKSSCAAGGGVSEGCIEIQGDHRDRIVELLRKLGYKAKPAGG